MKARHPWQAKGMDENCAKRWAQGEIPTKDDVQIQIGDEDFMVWIPQIKQEWLNSVKIVNGGLALKLFWQKGAQGKGSAPPFGVRDLTLYFPEGLLAQMDVGVGPTGQYLVPTQSHWSAEHSTYIFLLRKAVCTYK